MLALDDSRWNELTETIFTMSRTYRVLVVGLGKRGLHHATFFKANRRFELIGISSRGVGPSHFDDFVGSHRPQALKSCWTENLTYT